MLIGVQILVVLFALFMLYYSFIHYKRKEFNKNTFILWEIVWALIIIFVMFPITLFPLASILTLSSTFDLLLVLGLLFLFSLNYYTFILTKKTERKIEKLVRNIAEKK